MRWLVGVVVVVVIALLGAFVAAVVLAASIGLGARKPGRVETSVMNRVKSWHVGGKNQRNPLPDTPAVIQMGAEHFQHHCEICHGLDGQNTGVPFADSMSPPVANLASPRVQRYTDGQLKWIIDNGIRFTGMPGWKGDLADEEAWAIVRYIRHLPPKGSLGIPAFYKEAEEEHEQEQPHAHPPATQEKYNPGAGQPHPVK